MRHGPHDPDRRRSRQRDGRQNHECAAREVRTHRPALQLIEHVGGHAHREEERCESGTQPPRVQMGSERRADRDVGQIPRRVRSVKEGHEVPPPTGAQRVERRTLKRW